MECYVHCTPSISSRSLLAKAGSTGAAHPISPRTSSLKDGLLSRFSRFGIVGAPHDGRSSRYHSGLAIEWVVHQTPSARIRWQSLSGTVRRPPPPLLADVDEEVNVQPFDPVEPGAVRKTLPEGRIVQRDPRRPSWLVETSSTRSRTLSGVPTPSRRNWLYDAEDDLFDSSEIDIVGIGPPTRQS